MNRLFFLLLIRPAATCLALVWSCLLVGGLAAVAEEESYQEVELTAEDRDHWAFQPLSRPPLPVLEDAARLRNGIDFFVQSRLFNVHAQGLNISHPYNQLLLN